MTKDVLLALEVERRLEELLARYGELRLTRLDLQGRLEQTAAEMLRLEGAIDSLRSLLERDA